MLGFDCPGSPSEETIEVVDNQCALIASCSGSSIGILRTRFYQKMSYATWSSCVIAILGWVAPQHSRASLRIQAQLEVI